MIHTGCNFVSYHIGSLYKKLWYRPQSHLAEREENLQKERNKQNKTKNKKQQQQQQKKKGKDQNRFVCWEDCRRAQSNCNFKITTEEVSIPSEDYDWCTELDNSWGKRSVLWGCRGISYIFYPEVGADSLDLFKEHQQSLIAHWGLSLFVSCFVLS